MLFKLNPITAKRIARFKSIRRAYWSLWILGILYALSLASELVCNDKPLILRYQGKTYFPAFKYYAIGTFFENGSMDRMKAQDYRLMDFTKECWMLWPLIRSNPYEHIPPAELSRHTRCTARLYRQPRLAKAVVLAETFEMADLTGGELFGVGEWSGKALGDLWNIPESFQKALSERFANKPCDAVTIRCDGKDGIGAAELSLLAYEPRKRPPKKVNVTLREGAVSADGLDGIWQFDPKSKSRQPLRRRDTFAKLPEILQIKMRSKVQELWEGKEVATEVVEIEGVAYELSFEMEEVRFPFRPVRGIPEGVSTPAHLMGLDDSGRDVLARILYGLRTSLSFGLILVICSLSFGTLIGSVQGYLGGWVDITGQRLIEIWSALPFLYIIILMGSVYGPSFWLLIVCYALFNWIGMSYYMRAEMLRLKRLPFVEAAKCLGLPGWKIVLKHILPNALVPLVTFFPFSLVGAVGALAALDYLGFGLPPPTASLGQLLQQAQSQKWAWWLILYPSLALFVVMLLGVFIGEGVREAFDPKRQSRLQ
ncbi:MAG: ABC transporter permease subunit [Victivallales bacterium]|nr:ABC transporter permease subunit [Victivallales bacterium]